MPEDNKPNEMDEYAANVLKAENRFYQEVTITKVTGDCPYGHKEGETFKVTAMNSDKICGSLLKAIFLGLSFQSWGGHILLLKSTISCPYFVQISNIFALCDRSG